MYNSKVSFNDTEKCVQMGNFSGFYFKNISVEQVVDQMGFSPPIFCLCVLFSTVISVDRLKKMNFAGAKLPRYQSLRGPRPADLETVVTLPDSVFQPPVDTKGHRHLDVFPESSLRNRSTNRKRRHPDNNQQDAIASVIIFYSLAMLLPESYDPDKRSLR